MTGFGHLPGMINIMSPPELYLCNIMLAPIKTVFSGLLQHLESVQFLGPTTVDAGESVASLSAALAAHGLDLARLEASSQRALRAMLTWHLPATRATAQLKTAVLAFSFDATRSCRSLHDCPRPGPSNELLAATVEHFVAAGASGASAGAEVFAQWEIAAALQSRLPQHQVHAAGKPGQYMNTVQILESMMRGVAQFSPQRLLVLAHPDHLRRAYLTVRHFLNTTTLAASVLPAMAPYGLDWPTNRSEGASINLYAGVTGTVHTAGRTMAESWYSENLGFFPDGDPQAWVHDREVWVLYDHWAMCKGVATGII